MDRLFLQSLPNEIRDQSLDVSTGDLMQPVVPERRDEMLVYGLSLPYCGVGFTMHEGIGCEPIIKVCLNSGHCEIGLRKD